MQPIPTHRPRPAVLTIAEVMDVLRIGRTKAYEQARLYLDTNGEDGLPCIKVGDSIRFLRHAIEDLIGEPITTTLADHDDTDPPVTATPTRTNRRHPATDINPQLFTA
ncbi:helix-turn-helix domain-containing protein [Ilumatobacter nonamiensis]|uniref:helix-turn-helix domain-containing protein n=1 Tax=Ilumatobacter nonamiensis TaxID=467093 RepID=UPI000349C4AF|nr:helix-turn-helix domain-containing protein [Ilumatobacter nonamiensis]